MQALWNQILLFTPPDVYDQFFSHVKNCDSVVQQRMEEIFEEGMRHGLIRNDNVRKMTISYRAMREGLLNVMIIFLELTEEYIKEFWKDYWLGIKGRE